MNDQDLLLAIQELLDGVVWSPDTLDQIASLMVRSGYRIRDAGDRDRPATEDDPVFGKPFDEEYVPDPADPSTRRSR